MENELGAGLFNLLRTWGASADSAGLIRSAIIITGIIVVAILSNFITKRLILKIVKKIVLRSKTDYDDIFQERKVFTLLSHIVPALIIYVTIPLAFSKKIIYPFNYVDIIEWVRAASYVYMIVVFILVLNSFLDAVHDVYKNIAEKKHIRLSIKVYIQVVKILIIIIGIILIFAALLGQEPRGIFMGLGALAAVLLLIFKDTILGFVASIQLSAYKMVKVGDWITMPSRKADGDVIDISLSTVKVQNFNKTISTIPTYAMVSESFTNWQAMQASGGRRIKRSIHIDTHSIKFLDADMIERFRKINLLSDYIDQTEKEIAEHNKRHKLEELMEVNGRNLTNLGTFRKYIELYLKANLRHYKKIGKKSFVVDNKKTEYFVIAEKEDFLATAGAGAEKFIKVIDGENVLSNFERFLIEYPENFLMENDDIYFVKRENIKVIRNGNVIEEKIVKKQIEVDGLFVQEMTQLVRQLQPTEKGIPIEVYVFASTTAWGNYENIQADLFDHLFAILPKFDLKVFQNPSGNEFFNAINPKK